MAPTGHDYLSRLPNELLHQIWDDTYLNWEKEGEEGRSTEKLTGPLSKRLLGFQQRGLYRNVEVRRWTGPRSFAVLVETVTKQPHLGAMIESLRFDISPDSLQGQDHELDGPAVRAFLDLLSKIRRLTLAGGISMDGTVLKLYSQFTAPFHILAFILDNPNVIAFSNTFNRELDSLDQEFLASSFSKMHSSQISHLAILPRDDRDLGFGDDVDVCLSTLTCHLRTPSSQGLDTDSLPALSSDQPAAPSTSSLLPKPSTPAQSDRPPVPHIFSQLELVLLESETSEISSPLLDILPRFPIKDLILEIKNIVPISSLLSLVSKCSTLRHLDLHYYGYPGSIGTRVSTVDFNSVFPSIDPDTEDIMQDAMPDDWQYPHLPPSWPVDDLLLLREKAVEAGIELSAEGLYGAIEVQQAASEDIQLLSQLWQEWKQNRKKTKKGGKARKSKK